jgi:hypothetical protein
MISRKGFKADTPLMHVAYINSNLFPNKEFNSHKYVNRHIHVSSSMMEEGRKEEDL